MRLVYSAISPMYPIRISMPANNNRIYMIKLAISKYFHCMLSSVTNNVTLAYILDAMDTPLIPYSLLVIFWG